MSGLVSGVTCFKLYITGVTAEMIYEWLLTKNAEFALWPQPGGLVSARVKRVCFSPALKIIRVRALTSAGC